MICFASCWQYVQFICFALFIHVTGFSQGPSKVDYRRAVDFLWENLNNQLVFNLHVDVNWFEDSSGFWFIKHQSDEKLFFKLEINDPTLKPLFDHQWLASELNKVSDEPIQSNDLPISIYNEESPFKMKIECFKTKYQLDLNEKVLSQMKEDKSTLRENEKLSPDGNWIAFTKDYNLYIRDTKTQKEFQLSSRGYKNYEFGSYYGWYDKMEGENGTRPFRLMINWSPNSKWIQTQICDLRYANKMHLLDYSIDTLYRPKLISYYRGSPGDTTLVHYIPVFYNVESKQEILPKLPRNTHINPVRFRWTKYPDKVYVSYAERGYKYECIKELDLVKNEISVLIEEHSTTNIDNFGFRAVDRLGKIYFTSERSGWKLLYCYDIETRQTHLLTPGNYFVHDIKGIDVHAGHLYFTASGREKGSNPYHRYLYRIKLDGSDQKLMSPEPGNHEISLSPDYKYYVDNYSTVEIPTKTYFRSAQTGKIITQIGQADIQLLTEKKWNPPQTFTAIGRDGKTKIYGAIWKPTNFDAELTYPVIDHSYTGPHTQVFPNRFISGLRASNQSLAELGFVVIRIDGMGSAGRSKAFHDVSYKNMGKNLLGHKLAILQLADQYSWIDTSRVGIFGHSAGGYDAAHALLEFPDFYKVAVASSADHDFRMEKAWWPEMYMGWPVDSSYEQVSNITMAPNLKGKLLLVHGGLDDNVNPSATHKLAEALIKADKEFELLIIPSQRHGYQGSYAKYFLKKRWNYFVQHLLGSKPLWNVNWKNN